ncbi:leukocyte elastase inhibitor-like [Athalia rosae]|uniref:leukocyte elastase inhibitor-like n=1 Tax=Athalia rosae TaxID=37344 RepID=UPI0020348E6C|nr:leukocyte elastase inhibitor-like [Athalia rosae]
MKSVFILVTLASWSTGQLIYPDQFESMVAATPKTQNIQQSDPTQFNNFVDNGRVSGFAAPISPSPPLASNSVYAPRAPPRDTLDPMWNARANDVISKGIMRFALNMDNAVSTSRARYFPGSRENTVFSPLSIAVALSLVLLGSAGKTHEEVANILGLNAGVDVSRNSEVVHQMFGVLLDSVSNKPGTSGTELSFASGIFVKDGFPIRNEYRAVSQNVYKSEVFNLDFASGRGRPEAVVNRWVQEKTRGKIPTILNGPPPAETSVIIASALYFNGEWNQFFIDGATRRKTFTVAPGETVEVDMMYNGGEFPFFEDRKLKAKILGLPYKGREVTMYVVLPTDRSPDAIRTLERNLDVNTLETLIRSVRNETCIIGLPRMKLSSTLSLRDSLQALGLNSLFDPATADLSLLSPGYTGDSSATRQPTQRPPNRGTDNVVFPTRFGENDDGDKTTPPVSKNYLKPNYFTYDDKARGYRIEQWATGFSIGRIPGRRSRRNISMGRWLAKRRGDMENSKSLRESVPSSSGVRRERRQVRPMNPDFVNYMGYQNQPSYGLDDLRRSGNLANPGIYADDVLHRVEIDISEKGTVAAAATGVVITKDGNQKRFVADRPFLFLIRDEPTGLVSFWGTVYKPTPNYPVQSPAP